MRHDLDNGSMMIGALGFDRTAINITSSGLLKWAAMLWFVTAAAGQWTFVIYIVGHYYSPTLQGHFEAWNNRDLITGYVAGDVAGNLYFAAHVLLAAIITAAGTLQLVPSIRRHAISFHRWNGRLYLTTAFIGTLSGLWMVWVRGTYLTLTGAISGTILSGLILACGAMALYHVRQGSIDLHRQWAMRTFLVVNGVWFQRIGYMSWIILNQGPVGIGRHMDGPFDLILGFAEYVIPLGVLELYFFSQVQPRPWVKMVMSLGLVLAAAIMAVGIYGTYAIMWSRFQWMAN
jgi:uncharacterized membrane protein